MSSSSKRVILNLDVLETSASPLTSFICSLVSDVFLERYRDDILSDSHSRKALMGLVEDVEIFS
jgi:hypothetical protein